MLKKSQVACVIGFCSLLFFPDLLLANQAKTDTVLVEQLSQENKVNINRAGADELASKIKGIGMKKAQQIVTFREKHGLFTRIEQLQDVPGIGSHIVQLNLAILTL